MGVRARVGRGLDSALGQDRTDKIRATERRYRTALATRLAPPAPPARPGRRPKPRAEQQAERQAGPRTTPRAEQVPGRWAESDPFAAYPTPTASRHDLLRGLHERLQPRTYLEIGVNTGGSLALSRTRTIAIDPAFAVRSTLHCDLDLVCATSDDYFARPDAFGHFEGVPVDLSFIDGMHLSEFALRDFMNVERQLAATGVAVFDDVLPRNALEAARDRRTRLWAGDIFKTVEILARRRPDLVVLLVNTAPTGTAVIVGGDPSSQVLHDHYDAEVSYLEGADPQEPPREYLTRAAAVDPQVLLASEAWSMLVAAREKDDPALLAEALATLRAIPTLGSR